MEGQANRWLQQSWKLSSRWGLVGSIPTPSAVRWGGRMAKETDCIWCYFVVEICSIWSRFSSKIRYWKEDESPRNLMSLASSSSFKALEVLSNWLARLTVNQVLTRRVGSNPTTSTKSTTAWFLRLTVSWTWVLKPKSWCFFNRVVEESGLSRLIWIEEHAGSNPAYPTW